MSRHHHATEARWCVGGRWAGDEFTTLPCLEYGQHKSTCAGHYPTCIASADDGPIYPDPSCKGCCRACQPRLADQGWLCEHDHNRLNQWLGDGTPNSLLWAYRWLGSRIARAQTPSSDDGRGKPTKPGEMPLVIREDVHDCRQLLQDRIYIAEERARQVGIGGDVIADLPPFDLAESISWLRNHLLRIEDHRDLIATTWRHLQDSMVTAHRIAPWRPTATLVRGSDGPIPCPNCQRATLMQFGGDDFVTCTTCGAVVLSSRFDQWTAMIEFSRGESM